MHGHRGEPRLLPLRQRLLLLLMRRLLQLRKLLQWLLGRVLPTVWQALCVKQVMSSQPRREECD